MSQFLVISESTRLYGQGWNNQDKIYWRDLRYIHWKSCVIGIGTTILGGVKIGNYCVIGAGAVVSKDIPDNTIVAGNPARVIKEVIEFDDRRI